MKLTQILCKQHLGRMKRFNWYSHGFKTILNLKAEEALTPQGIAVKDPNEIVNPPKEKIDYTQFDFLVPEPIEKNEFHPDYKKKPCLNYENNNVLLEGLPQAQIITKTVVYESLPNEWNTFLNDETSEKVNNYVKKIIESSNIFDAHQEKLPKVKDPKRPAWNFPRSYGITDVRKSANLCKKFLHLCEALSGPNISNNRTIINDALVSVPFEKDSDIYKFSLVLNMMVMSNDKLRPVKPVINDDHDLLKLPDLYPMHFAIGIDKEHFYDLENRFPILPNHGKNLHTVFSFYDPVEVQNKTKLPVRETQKLGRIMIKAFTVTAAFARQKYGEDVKELPKPITVQMIESDGKSFYFSVYQLNTLDIDAEAGIKNYWWTAPKINLFETAGYFNGAPYCSDINTEVFKNILAFYKNN